MKALLLIAFLLICTVSKGAVTVLGVASSILINGTNFTVYKTMSPAEWSGIRRIYITNPPAAPSNLLTQVSWKSPITIFVGNSLETRTQMSVTATCSVVITNSDPSIFVSLPVGTNALSVKLSWDASASPEVTRYTVWYGADTANYTNHVAVDAPALEAVVSGLEYGAKYYFAATADNAAGQASVFSNEVTCVIPRVDIPVTIRLY